MNSRAEYGSMNELSMREAEDKKQLARAEAQITLQAAALEAAANCIVITDRDGVILWTNPAFTALTGFTAEEAVGKNPRILKSGRQKDGFYRSLWQTILSGRVWHGELINRRKDGSLYTEEQTITPVIGSSGEITHFVAVKQDVTERRRVEENLRESERRFRELAENIREVFFIAGPTGDPVLYVTPVYEEIWGRSRESLYANPRAWIEAVHSEDQERVMEAYKRSPGNLDQEYRIVRPDGSIKWIYSRAFPVRDGKGAVLRVVGIAEDVTRRRLAEEEAKRNLDRIRALHEIDIAITSSLDLQNVLDVLLEKIDVFFPYETATTVRLRDGEPGKLAYTACRNLDGEDWKEKTTLSIRGRGTQIIETKQPMVVRNLQTDPSTRHRSFYPRNGLVSYLGVPLMTQDQVLGILSLYTKEEHEFTKDEIDFLVTLAGHAAIAIHNAQVYEQVAKSNSVKDDFLNIMSHELRTPLNVVMGYTAMIKDGFLGEVNVQQEAALQKVIDQANDQLSMINNVLYATVLEVQKPALDVHEASPADCLDQLRSDYDARLQPEGLTLQWHYSHDLPSIQTDCGKLRVILQNLIGNAIKFTGKGVVTISAGIAEDGDDRRWLELKVKDTGVGISKEQLPFIFEKFYQADSSQTRSFGGVGMGLYIVKRFTELLGGTVTVESQPGKGSNFTVTIPVDSEWGPHG